MPKRPAPKRPPEIQRAIDAAGGLQKLADGLGIKAPSICDWTAIPSYRIARVAEITNLPIEQLLPSKAHARRRAQRMAAQ